MRPRMKEKITIYFDEKTASVSVSFDIGSSFHLTGFDRETNDAAGGFQFNLYLRRKPHF